MRALCVVLDVAIDLTNGVPIALVEEDPPSASVAKDNLEIYESGLR